MKLRFLLHPETKQPDALLTMSCLVVLMCAIKFMFEGIELHIFGHVISFGHADAASYAAMLTPVLGAHGASEYKRIVPRLPRPTAQIDDPDGCEN